MLPLCALCPAFRQAAGLLPLLDGRSESGSAPLVARSQLLKYDTPPSSRWPRVRSDGRKSWRSGSGNWRGVSSARRSVSGSEVKRKVGSSILGSSAREPQDLDDDGRCARAVRPCDCVPGQMETGCRPRIPCCRMGFAVVPSHFLIGTNTPKGPIARRPRTEQRLFLPLKIWPPPSHLCPPSK